MNQQEIETIVRRVIEQLNHPGSSGGEHGIYQSLDDAVAAASSAQNDFPEEVGAVMIIRLARLEPSPPAVAERRPPLIAFSCTGSRV